MEGRSDGRGAFGDSKVSDWQKHYETAVFAGLLDEHDNAASDEDDGDDKRIHPSGVSVLPEHHSDLRHFNALLAAEDTGDEPVPPPYPPRETAFSGSEWPPPPPPPGDGGGSSTARRKRGVSFHDQTSSSPESAPEAMASPFKFGIDLETPMTGTPMTGRSRLSSVESVDLNPKALEALSPFTECKSPDVLRHEMRVAIHKLKKKLDAGLVLRRLMWDDDARTYEVVDVKLFREKGGFWWVRGRREMSLAKAKEKRESLGASSPGRVSRTGSFFARSLSRARSRSNSQDDSASKDDASAPGSATGSEGDASDVSGVTAGSTEGAGFVMYHKDRAHVRWDMIESLQGQVRPEQVESLEASLARFTFSIWLTNGVELDFTVPTKSVYRSLIIGFESAVSHMRDCEERRGDLETGASGPAGAGETRGRRLSSLDELFMDARRRGASPSQCESERGGSLDGTGPDVEKDLDDLLDVDKDASGRAIKGRQLTWAERWGVHNLHALYRDDHHPSRHGAITKGTRVQISHEEFFEDEHPYHIEFPVPLKPGEKKRRYVRLKTPCPLFRTGMYVNGEVVASHKVEDGETGQIVTKYRVKYVSGPFFHVDDENEGTINQLALMSKRGRDAARRASVNLQKEFAHVQAGLNDVRRRTSQLLHTPMDGEHKAFWDDDADDRSPDARRLSSSSDFGDDGDSVASDSDDDETRALKRPPNMPDGTRIVNVQREFMDVDVDFQAYERFPVFTVGVLAFYWVKFAYDHSQSAKNIHDMHGSVKYALEAVSDFESGCDLQLDRQHYRLLSYQMVHLGVEHIFTNTMVLIILGSVLEMVHGWIIGLVFMCGIVGGAMVAVIFDTYSRVVGFSAGVYCILGIHFGNILLNFHEMRDGILNRWTRLLIFAVFFSVDILLSMNGGVSITIHCAGFLYGVLLSCVFLHELVEHRHIRLIKNLARLALAFGFACCVFRYHYFIVEADPPRPLTYFAQAQVKDCCYLLRSCHIDARFHDAFTCDARTNKYSSLFKGTGTVLKRNIEILWAMNATLALKDDGGAFSECHYLEAWLKQVWQYVVQTRQIGGRVSPKAETRDADGRRLLLDDLGLEDATLLATSLATRFGHVA